MSGTSRVLISQLQVSRPKPDWVLWISWGLPIFVGMAAPMRHAEGWVPADTFGARLALIRQAQGWSATEAALECGDLGDQNWRNWEDGKIPRDLPKVCAKIQERTRCNLDWLIRGGPLEPQKFWLSMRPDLLVLPGEAETTERTRGHLRST